MFDCGRFPFAGSATFGGTTEELAIKSAEKGTTHQGEGISDDSACVTGRGQTILEPISTTFSSQVHQSSTPQSPLQSLLVVLPLPRPIYKYSGPSAINNSEKFTRIPEYPETILWSITGTSGIDGPPTSWKVTLSFEPTWCHSPQRCEIEKGSPLLHQIHPRRQALHELLVIVDHGVHLTSPPRLLCQEGAGGGEEVRPMRSSPKLLCFV